MEHADDADENAENEQNEACIVEVHGGIESEDMDGIRIVREESDESDELESSF